MNRSSLPSVCSIIAVALCIVASLWLAAAPARAQLTFVTTHSFSPQNGTDPSGALIQGSDGNFYGSTSSGGAGGDGTVYKIAPSGTLTTLVNFNGTNGTGPSGLVQGSDGNFYGTTSQGGSSIPSDPNGNGYGTVFQVTPGGTMTTLYNFTGGADGTGPSSLVQGSDGDFYGTTSGGGASDDGTAFEITPDGALTTLYSFTGGTDGSYPSAVIQGSNGNFYGTTDVGGTYGGTVFQITPGGTLTTLYSFTGGTDGAGPNGLVQGSDGNFYGTTVVGGSSIPSDPNGQGYGTVFEVTPGGALTTLYSFSGGDGGYPQAGSNGEYPQTALVQGSDGDFYGTTPDGGAFYGGTVFKITSGGTLTTLYNFANGTDGGRPMASLIQASDGNFYGTTYDTIFKITPSGTLATFYTFTDTDGTDPQASLVQGSDGNFYGTTSIGGASDSGTVFKVTSTGALTSLYSFTLGIDSAEPQAALVRGSDGNFYGTTYYGGSSGDGTVFQVTPAGSLTTLYNFMNGTDGANPSGALVQGSDGNFYGTARGGGANNNGTVFQITSTGSLTTLYSFTGSGDGGLPVAGLVQDNGGNFYGTTYYGGANGNGTMFQITSTGSLTTLYSFTGGTDGAYPAAALVQGSDGNFYGTTGGGANGYGTVFQITSAGALTSLHNFTGGTDGAYPAAALAQGSDGNFYGTTEDGGSAGYGNIFQITPSGTLTVIHSFSAWNFSGKNSDGAHPLAALVQGDDGNFYGTTSQGGVFGDGTIFGLFGPPTTFGASETTSENTPVTFPVAFDDPSGKGIASVAFPTTPAHGTVAAGAVTETGGAGTVALTYTPAAGYSGTDSFTYTVTSSVVGTSTPHAVALTVTQTPATVTVSPSSATLAENGTQTFTADVFDAGGVVFTPASLTWSVSDGATINAATGVFDAGTTPGTYTVTATATSGGVTQTGTATVTVVAPPTCTVNVTTSANPSVYAQPVTISVAVAGSAATPMGTVTLTIQDQTGIEETLATVTLSNGVAQYLWDGRLPGATCGLWTITASYSGDGTYPATTVTVFQTVNVGQTATSLSVSASAPPLNQPITLTATVTAVAPSNTTNPNDGAVQFYDGATPLGSAAAINASGVATLTTTLPAVGTYSLSARYLGNVRRAPSSSNTVSVTVTDAAPTVATPASATPSPVTGTTTNLSILGSYVGGESNLIYTWSASPSTGVTFSANGTNAAKIATATFAHAGAYALTATIADPYGKSVTSTVSVVVAQTPTSVTVSPATVSLALNGTRTFTASLTDQFGNAVASSLTWSVTGVGTINATTGVFTAGTKAGTATVTVKSVSGGVTKTGTATGTVVAPPKLTLTAGTQTSTTAPFTATGTSGDGTALTYAWSVSPTATYTGATTGGAASGAAFANTLTVTAAGTYTVTVKITDAYGQTATATKTATFAQAPTTVTVAPSIVTVPEGGTQTFTATVKDQFGVTFTPATLTWSVAVSGTINAITGAYTAGMRAGTFTVTAKAVSGGVTKTGTAAVTVAAPPTVVLTLGTQTSVAAPFTATGTSGNGAALTYAWSVSPAANFASATTGSAASGAAFSNTLTVTAAGSYTVTVKVTDAYGQTATATKTATFSHLPTTVTVSPSSVSVAAGGTQTFTASVKDQFGVTFTPALTWSVSGGGTINATTGVFTAGTKAGTFTVTAKAVSGGVTKTATATVTVL